MQPGNNKNKMDDLSSDFGDLGLSSMAREWKPPGVGPQQLPPSLPHSQVPAHFQRQPHPPPPPSRNQQSAHLTSNLTPLNRTGSSGSTTPAAAAAAGAGRGPARASSTNGNGTPASSSSSSSSAAVAAKDASPSSSSVGNEGTGGGKADATTTDNSSIKSTPNLPSGERNDWEELESELNAATVKEYVPGRVWGDDKSRAESVGSQGEFWLFQKQINTANRLLLIPEDHLTHSIFFFLHSLYEQEANLRVDKVPTRKFSAATHRPVN